MAIFSIYFAICLFGLLIRGYYRVPKSCIIQETLDKSENTYKSIIANRLECKCHYTNFLWDKPYSDDNRTIINNSLGRNNDEENEKQTYESMALVRNIKNKKNFVILILLDS
jgi:hypothetical protein